MSDSSELLTKDRKKNKTNKKSKKNKKVEYFSSSSSERSPCCTNCNWGYIIGGIFGLFTIASFTISLIVLIVQLKPVKECPTLGEIPDIVINNYAYIGKNQSAAVGKRFLGDDNFFWNIIIDGHIIVNTQSNFTEIAFFEEAIFQKGLFKELNSQKTIIKELESKINKMESIIANTIHFNSMTGLGAYIGNLDTNIFTSNDATINGAYITSLTADEATITNLTIDFGSLDIEYISTDEADMGLVYINTLEVINLNSLSGFIETPNLVVQGSIVIDVGENPVEHVRGCRSERTITMSVYTILVGITSFNHTATIIECSKYVDVYFTPLNFGEQKTSTEIWFNVYSEVEWCDNVRLNTFPINVEGDTVGYNFVNTGINGGCVFLAYSSFLDGLGYNYFRIPITSL